MAYSECFPRVRSRAAQALILAAAAAVLPATHVHAAQWIQTGAGPFSWATSTNWNGPVPNTTTAEADLSVTLAADQTVIADGQTAGIVDIGDGGSQHVQTLQGTTNLITRVITGLNLGAFDTPASINLDGSTSTPSSSIISSPLNIGQNAVLSFTSATKGHIIEINTLTLSGGLSGTTFTMDVENADVILASPSNAIATTVESSGTLQLNDSGDLTGNVTVAGTLKANGATQTFAALNILPSGVVDAGSTNVQVGQFDSSMTFSGTVESADNGGITILSADVTFLGTVTNLGNIATAQNAIVNIHVGSGVGGDTTTLTGAGNLVSPSFNTLIAGASGKGTETFINNSNIVGSLIITSLNLVNGGAISSQGTIHLESIPITNTGDLDAVEPGSTLSIVHCTVNNLGGIIKGQAGGAVTLVGNTTIAGGQLVTSSDDTSGTIGQIEVDTHTTPGIVVFDGAAHGPITNNAALFINALSTAQFTGSFINDQTLTLDASANATISGTFIGPGNLTLAASSAVTLDPTTSPLLQTSALMLFGSPGAWTSGLNLNHGKLIVEDASSTHPTTLASIKNQVAYGLTHTDGIYSSALTDPVHQTIAVVDNAVAKFINFGGTPVDSGSILAMQTYFGDANLDGTVGLSDLAIILNNFGQSTPDWSSGNFDGDDTIDLTDLADVLNNFGQSISNPSAAHTSLAAPEPASIALFAAVALCLVPKRRPGTGSV